MSLPKSAVWYPFTQMSEPARAPFLSIVRGRGNYLYDAEGRKYFDGVSSLWCNLHGHGVPELTRAIARQADRLAHSTLLGLTHPGAEDLAKRLTDIAPRGLTRMFYSDDGATAAEVALKMAYQFWRHRGESRRDRFISFKLGYHGDTLGAVSVGGVDLFHSTFRPLLFRGVKVDPPYCYRCPLKLSFPSCRYKCLEAVETALKKNQRRLAAFILEPKVIGAGGIIVQPRGYLSRLAKLCRAYRVPIIADEVATGFGRTGRMFACEHENVRPDFMCVAKGLTGGTVPLAATLTTDRVYRAFLGRYEEAKTFFHGHTYTGNPVGCAAALANLDLFKRRRILQHLPAKIRFFSDELAALRNLPHVGDVRQAGFMVGVELVRRRATREPYSWEEGIGRKVCARLRARGILLRPLGNVLVLMPPLSSTLAELRRLVQEIKGIIPLVC
ncbi:adenosylmethionine--8-amino-7-oxononanoate transaminase [bacterium]|nr:adenosylmethionine--8-amino-7-oxononanoate transaminase [bacterium]